MSNDVFVNTKVVTSDLVWPFKYDVEAILIKRGHSCNHTLNSEHRSTITLWSAKRKARKLAKTLLNEHFCEKKKTIFRSYYPNDFTLRGQHGSVQ